MVVGLVPGLVVGVREGIEAALVVGIILAYLTKIGQRSYHRYVWWGTLLALIASIGAAGLFAGLKVGFEGRTEELFEGFAAIVAVLVLTSMILWMMRAAKNLRRHFEQKIDLLVNRGQVMGLAFLAFIAVFREGVETVLFIAGLTGIVAGADIVAGVVIGLLVAALVGFGIFASSWKVNLRRFFQGTGLLLVIIAAGLFAFGVHELQEAGVIPWLSGEIYNVQASFSDGEANPFGYVLRGLVGYNDNPTQVEGVAYGAYWLFTVVAFLGIKTGKLEILTRPLRELGRRLRRKRSTTAEPEDVG